ncbi:hypothetical protein D3C87_358690 [compost metagenome]
MSASQTTDSAKPEELELDEAFLERVDRAVLLSKQRDPFRLEEVHRALEHEVRLTAFEIAQKDRRPRGTTHEAH